MRRWACGGDLLGSFADPPEARTDYVSLMLCRLRRLEVHQGDPRPGQQVARSRRGGPLPPPRLTLAHPSTEQSRNVYVSDGYKESTDGATYVYRVSGSGATAPA